MVVAYVENQVAKVLYFIQIKRIFLSFIIFACFLLSGIDVLFIAGGE